MKIWHPKKNYNLEGQISMECGLNLSTKHLNNKLSEIMPTWDLKLSKTKSRMQAEDTS